MQGDDLHGLALGEEPGGVGHPFPVEPFAGGAAQFALAETLELAHGDAEQLRGGLEIVARALGEGPPMLLGGR